MEFAVNNSTTHLANFRRKCTWFTIRDGNWSDPTIWQGNRANRRGVKFPNSASDDVYINHTVSLDNNSFSASHPLATAIRYDVNNLFVSGTLRASSTLSIGILAVNGNVKCTGTIDGTGSSTGYKIALMGYDNSISNYIKGTVTLSYEAPLDQTVLPLDYYGLGTGGGSTKWLTTNTVITGPFVCSSTLECGNYDFTVGGASSNPTQIGVLSKTGGGNLLFIGAYGTPSSTSPIARWTGNPNVEFRNGYYWNPIAPNVGNGLLSFTTNNQSIGRVFGSTVTVPNIYVGAGVVLDWSGSASVIVDTLDGPGTVNMSGDMQLRGVGAQLINPMASGTLNLLSTSTVQYMSNYPSTISITNFPGNLSCLNANRSLSGNTTIGGNLLISNTLECSNYNLSVNGTTGGGLLSKTGPGNLLFVGRVGNTAALIFSLTGNPSLEFRGGLAIYSTSSNYGIGAMNFVTNNQVIIRYGGGGIYTISNPITIAPDITVTNDASMDLTLSGVLTGMSSGSKFDNRGIVRFTNTQEPMQTGILECNAAANSVFYSLNGNQNIQAGNYRNLTLNIGGSKKLLGNVSVASAYSLITPATLDANGFSITNP